MESRAKALGHAIHPMLIVFPLGLLATAVVFDILQLITGNDDFDVAAVFGLIDWLAIPDGTRAKRIGLLHGVGNVVVVVLFAVSWLIRAAADAWNANAAAVTLGILGVLVAGVTGWLGGELVERLGVGVDPGAGLDAPSSLGWSARDSRRSMHFPRGHTA